MFRPPMRGIEGNRAASREGRKGDDIGGRSRNVILLKTPFLAVENYCRKTRLPVIPISAYSVCSKYVRLMCGSILFSCRNRDSCLSAYHVNINIKVSMQCIQDNANRYILMTSLSARCSLYAISHYTVARRPNVITWICHCVAYLRRVINQKAVLVAAFDDVDVALSHAIIACDYQDIIILHYVAIKTSQTYRDYSTDRLQLCLCYSHAMFETFLLRHSLFFLVLLNYWLLA